MLTILGICILDWLFLYISECLLGDEKYHFPHAVGAPGGCHAARGGFLIGHQSLRGVAIAGVSTWIAAAVMLAAPYYSR